jgi:hypothetical protein
LLTAELLNLTGILSNDILSSSKNIVEVMLSWVSTMWLVAAVSDEVWPIVLRLSSGDPIMLWDFFD